MACGGGGASLQLARLPGEAASREQSQPQREVDEALGNLIRPHWTSRHHVRAGAPSGLSQPQSGVRPPKPRGPSPWGRREARLGGRGPSRTLVPLHLHLTRPAFYGVCIRPYF